MIFKFQCQYDFDPHSNPVGRDTLRKRSASLICPKYARVWKYCAWNLTLSKFASLLYFAQNSLITWHALTIEPRWILDKFSDAQRKYCSKLKWKSDQCQSFILQMYFLAVIKNSKSLFVSCQCHCIRYKSSKSVKEETTNIFCRCFGRYMLFSKLDTFYGPAVSYIQFPNTHIAIF